MKLAGEIERLRREHAIELHTVRVEGLAARRAEAAGLRTVDQKRCVAHVLNALRRHPVDAVDNFDAESVITSTLASLDPTRIDPKAGTVPRGVAPSTYHVDRAELARQRDLYAAKLKELGLQDPSMPSISSGALTR
jgi:hypothetical protein